MWRTAFKKLIEQCRGIFKNQQISKTELFAKILPVTIFTKSSISIPILGLLMILIIFLIGAFYLNPQPPWNLDGVVSSIYLSPLQNRYNRERLHSQSLDVEAATCDLGLKFISYIPVTHLRISLCEKRENKTWKREHLFKHFILCSSILKRIAIFQKFYEKVVQEVIFALDQCRISNYASLKQYCAIFFFWRQTVNSFRVRCCFVL